MMNGLIGQFDAYLANRRPVYYQELQPGVDEAALDAFQAVLKLELPSECRDLYRWRNGQNPNCSANLIDNWMFSPLYFHKGDVGRHDRLRF